jgi:hypothetical protein
MMAFGAENVAVKSALMAAEFDLRAAAPDIAADLTRHVADLLDRAQAPSRAYRTPASRVPAADGVEAQPVPRAKKTTLYSSPARRCRR